MRSDERIRAEREQLERKVSVRVLREARTTQRKLGLRTCTSENDAGEAGTSVPRVRGCG